jgi:hypothetical protein
MHYSVRLKIHENQPQNDSGTVYGHSISASFLDEITQNEASRVSE